MPFEILETVPKASAVPMAKIKYMRSTPRGKKNGVDAKPKRRRYPELTIALPTTICGIGKAKAHVFMLGTGADKGRARISGLAIAIDGSKAVVPRELKHCFVWNFGFVPSLKDEIADEEHVAVRKITDNEFEIDLPPWWK